MAHPRVWPCEVTVQLIRRESGGCRGPVAPPGAAAFTERPGWPEQELAHQRRPPFQAHPSPGARPGFPLWKPGCRCGLASEQRMEVWGRACAQSKGPGLGPRRHGPGAQLCGWFAGLKAPGSPQPVPAVPPPRPAFPHPELRLATSSPRPSSLRAALSGSWPFLLPLVVLPKVARDPLDPLTLERRFREGLQQIFRSCYSETKLLIKTSS